MKVIENPSLWKVKSRADNDEVSYISDNLLKIVMSNEYLESKLRSSIKLLDKAQNKALQSQMNPHFLYNTLEMINMEAMELGNGHNLVSAMISDLSELLRYGLDGEQYSTISGEIESVKCYLNIMKKRYEGRISIYWDINKDLIDYKIIKLSLQPLIENAIYHGIKPKKDKGHIEVIVKETLEGIMIEVSDDGIGMTPNEIVELNRRLNDKYLLKKSGIGLYNVNQRIKILYGEAFGLEIMANQDEGITVRMSVPLDK